MPQLVHERPYREVRVRVQASGRADGGGANRWGGARAGQAWRTPARCDPVRRRSGMDRVEDLTALVSLGKHMSGACSPDGIYSLIFEV